MFLEREDDPAPPPPSHLLSKLKLWGSRLSLPQTTSGIRHTHCLQNKTKIVQIYIHKSLKRLNMHVMRTFYVFRARNALWCPRALTSRCELKLFEFSAYCYCANAFQGSTRTFRKTDLVTPTIGDNADRLERQADTETVSSWQMGRLHAQLNEQEVTTVAWSATVINADINELSDLTSTQTNFSSTIFQCRGSRICSNKLTRDRVLPLDYQILRMW
jgi:hypothetical protein